MGIYLSTPATDIETENGEGNRMIYAVGEMQGWRKNMEDSHIADLEVTTASKPENPKVGLFGVFDGHGGKEVAKFVKIKYTEMLSTLKSFEDKDYETALKESFHKIDDLLEDHKFDHLLRELRALPSPSDGNYKPNMLAETVEVARAAALYEQNEQNGNNQDEDSNEGDGDGEGEQTEDQLSPTSPLSAPLAASRDDGSGTTTTNNNHNNSNNNSTDPEILASTCGGAAATLIRELIGGLSKNKENSNGESYNSDDVNISVKNGKNSTENNGTSSTDGSTSAGDDSSESPDTESEPVAGAGVAEYQAPSKESATGMICNLKNHRVFAGCTAVVALIVGDTLYCANAGDSRGVLCRKDGEAFNLSEDHKPQQAREMSRIMQAGGFVNMAGRINGNLNLSRSLGDLKYKQQGHLAKEKQIITAEPDVTTTKLEPDDRFFILACDGIWDCLSSQEACDFVSERLDAGMTPTEITKEVLNFCLAEDPRRSAGIGGDNITFLLTLLHQENKAQGET